jgi:hypothetical protein
LIFMTSVAFASYSLYQTNHQILDSILEPVFIDNAPYTASYDKSTLNKEEITLFPNGSFVENVRAQSDQKTQTPKTTTILRQIHAKSEHEATRHRNTNTRFRMATPNTLGESNHFGPGTPINPSRQDFTAKHAPIMLHLPDKTSPVRVRVLLFEHKQRYIDFRKDSTWAISDEVLNICMDGFERSQYFELLDYAIIPDDPNYFLKEEQNVVWVVDMRRFVVARNYSTVEQVARLANHTIHYQETKAIKPSLKVVFMDWRDKSSVFLCHREGTQQNVRQVTQQIVQGRKWDPKRQFPSSGMVLHHQLSHPCLSEFPTLQVPYTVRSDYAIAVEKKYAAYLPATKQNQSALTPADTLRPIDVAHFWSGQIQDRSANLRDAVTRTVLSLNDTIIHGNPIHVVGNVVSTTGSVGRTAYQKDYIQALLTTKVVVVAQRDEWEDHYRLFEAIIGGALVMTDPMLSLPDGYVDGGNILIYQSLDHMRDLIIHYLEHPEERLEIARKGWVLAMNRHRTFHWMEETFFGKALSTYL